MRSPSVRWLLLGANLFVLAVPLLAFGAFRVYDNYLVRQTERQLIAQAVVIGETWREFWQQETGRADAAAYRPPGREGEAFIPVEPVLNLQAGVLPPQPSVQEPTPVPEGPGLASCPNSRFGCIEMRRDVAPVLQPVQRREEYTIAA